MKITKLSNKALLNQIRKSNIAYNIFGCGCVLSMLISAFFDSDGTQPLLALAIMLFVATLFEKQTEINNKIRLEIREVKK